VLIDIDLFVAKANNSLSACSIRRAGTVDKLQMKIKLLAIGEAMAELRESDNGGYDVGFAGDTFNTAVYCARTLSSDKTSDTRSDNSFDNSVSFMSQIGMDPLSTSFKELAAKQTLNTAHITRDPDLHIGIYSVSTDSDGERSFHYWRNSSAARNMFMTDDQISSIPAATVIYLSGITLAILSPAARQRLMVHLSHLSKNGKSLIAFDSNYRPRLWESREMAQQVISDMWSIADIALPSIDDEMALFDEENEDVAITRFSQQQWSACAIKRGVRGPVSPGLPLQEHPQFRAAQSVVDTTAAGDSFNGAYLACYLSGKTEAECLSAAHACASRVVGHRGAIVPQE